MNAKLQEYFEYAANVWLSFAPSDLKKRFPRDFRFVVTVPHSFIGELPKELERARQLEVHIEAYDKTDEMAHKPTAIVAGEEMKSWGTWNMHQLCNRFERLNRAKGNKSLW